jgi:hypothetical protein
MGLQVNTRVDDLATTANALGVRVDGFQARLLDLELNGAKMNREVVVVPDEFINVQGKRDRDQGHDSGGRIRHQARKKPNQPPPKPVVVVPDEESEDEAAEDAYWEERTKASFIPEAKAFIAAGAMDMNGRYSERFLLTDYENTEWVAMLAESLGFADLEIIQSRKKSTVTKLAKAMWEQKMKAEDPGENFTGVRAVYSLRAALRTDLRELFKISQEKDYFRHSQSSHEGKRKRTRKDLLELISIHQDMLRFIRMYLVMFHPRNAQQRQIGQYLHDDIRWCLFASFEGQNIDWYDHGYGLVYVCMSETAYAGKAWILKKRQDQHNNKGSLLSKVRDRKLAGARERTNDAESEASKIRLYRQMAEEGTEKFDMFATRRAAVVPDLKLTGKKRSEHRRKCSRKVVKLEVKTMRAINSKLNDVGMQSKSKAGIKKRKSNLSKKQRVRKQKFRGHWGYRLPLEPKQDRVRTVRPSDVATYRVEGAESWSIDLTEILEAAVDGDIILCSPGDTVGTNWSEIELSFGETLIEHDGVQTQRTQISLKVWAKSWKKSRCTSDPTHGDCVNINIVSKKKCERPHGRDIRSLMHWARKRDAWQHKEPDLTQAYAWYNHIKRVKGSSREFVKKRLQWKIRKLGGEVVPSRIAFSVPAGVKVRQRDIRLWWLKMIEATKERLPDRVSDEWKAALVIIRSKGRCIADILVDAPKQSRDAKIRGDLGEDKSKRCNCHKHPDLVRIMKEKFPDVWEKTGHVHMAAADVPWPECAVGKVSAKSMVVGGYRHAEGLFWSNVTKLVSRVVSGVEARRYGKRMAEACIECVDFDKKTEMEFEEETVYRFKKKLKGLVVSVLDRDDGKLWITCPEAYDEYGRQHFKYAVNKQEWETWDEVKSGPRPSYWLVKKTEDELADDWKREFKIRNDQCGSRWAPWNEYKSRIISVRWQFKKKDVLRIRAIFSGIWDWTRDEAKIVAKIIRLIEVTVETDDFSTDSTQGVAVWLRGTEDDLKLVYGEKTVLTVRGTDFKEYFPSNTKLGVIIALKCMWQMIQDGMVRQGRRRPRGEWVNVPRGKFAVARWGKSSEPGVQNRKVSDAFAFLEFKAEVSNCFRVGDVVLQGEEVTIGEPSSPALCNCSAKLNEHKLMLTLSDEEKSAFRSVRYVDDGICVTAHDGSSEESKVMVEQVFVKIKNAYPGIKVTDEGECWAGGEAVDFLEYSIGVGGCGAELRWHHKNKNAESILSIGKQKFMKLRPWKSGSYSRQLLGTVRTRLCSMLAMTKNNPGRSGGMRGDGDVVRDMIASTSEFVAELHLGLQYPMRALIRLLIAMARTSELWCDVVCAVKQMAQEIENKEEQAAEEQKVINARHIVAVNYE